MCKVHVVDLGELFLFKICRVVKFSIQNLTRCKKTDSKSDKTKKSWFKIWQDEQFFIQNHAFYKKFLFKIMLFTKKLYSKSCFLQNIFIQNQAFYKNFKFKIVLF